VVCVIKHWQEEKYLCLQWKKVDWHGFVVGGIDEGEDSIAAAKREIEEETGYVNAKFVKKLGGIVHAQFYQTLKKENRRAHFQGLYFELENDKNVTISEKEQAIHDVKWLAKKEVAKFLNVPDMEIMWQRLWESKVYSGEGLMTNSGEYNGLTSSEFKEQIVKWLKKNKLGQATVNYKLHDWIFSRQRYWGEPIPMVYCSECGWLPVAEDELPIRLPEIADFQPTENGESPLAKVKDWIATTCPKCGGSAKRETDVMPNWAGSNWYFVRYCDPKNDKKLVDLKKAKHWLPVDWYNGGMEHTTLHLLYSRFVFKFLYDIGIIPKEIGSEPYKKRTAQGMVLGQGGIKMSKSKGNVINPDGYVEKYGADTVRTYEMFMGPFDQSIAWDDKGVIGVHRFLEKIWNLKNKISEKENNKDILVLLHKSIKKIDQDIGNMRFNTAISQLMILANALDKVEKINRKVFSDFVLIFSPFAPHLAEELWEFLGNKESLAYAQWPKYNEALAKDELVKIGIQINGKLRDEIELENDTEPSDQVKEKILAQEKVKKYTEGKELLKFIHIKNKIISIVVK
ncbi:NUDIX domain-containing protein, partial [Candidatus Parcubacteria bacterium]